MDDLADKVNCEDSILLTILWLSLLVLFAIVYVIATIFVALVKAASSLMVTG